MDRQAELDMKPIVRELRLRELHLRQRFSCTINKAE